MRDEEQAQPASDDDLFSLSVRAGKRTYFFDVKQTKRGEEFLVITESRKTGDMPNGQARFEKSRIHLYREDFGKFTAGLAKVCARITETYADDATQDADTMSTHAISAGSTQAELDAEFDAL